MKRFLRIPFFLLALSLLNPTLSRSSKPILFTGAKMIDGWNNIAFSDVNIVVQGNFILMAGKKYSTIPPVQSTVIDVSGKYIMPGLIDVHAQYRDEADLQMMFLMGVTSANLIISSSEQREAIERIPQADSSAFPDIFEMYTIPQKKNGNPASALTSLDTLLESMPGSIANIPTMIQALKNAGINHVYLQYDNLDWCTLMSERSGTQDTTILFAFLQEAKKRKLLVSVQAPHLQNSERVIGADAFSLLHGIIDERFPSTTLEKVRGRIFYYTPTLTFFEYLADGQGVIKRVQGDSLFQKAIPRSFLVDYTKQEYQSGFYSGCDNNEYIKNHLSVVFDNANSIFKDFIASPMGTNLPTLPGIAAHLELENMVKAGLSPMQAIISASVFSAEYLGVRDKVGFIYPNYQADFLILDKNPLEDIRNTRTISMIVSNGVLYDVKSLREKFQK